jgi:HAD superfamily hydrolase (TIGR01509 family)
MDDYFKRVKKYKTKTSAITSYGLSGNQAREIINKMDVLSFVNPDHELVEMINTLKKRNLTLSIFTNNKKSTLESIIEKIGLSPQHFDFLVTAEQVPSKPSIDGYLYVVQKSALPASQILFVGDRLEADIEPAREAGMHTVQVRCDKRSVDYDSNKGTYHFKRQDIYKIPLVVRVVDFLMTRQ